MENSNNDNGQQPDEVGSNLAGAAMPGKDRNNQENEPEAEPKSENTDALFGDVHPTARVDISQEQANGDSQNQ